MPSRKNKPGKYGTAPVHQAVFKPKRQRRYEASLKEACARWLWDAEFKRPDSVHVVPLYHMDGAILLRNAGLIDLYVQLPIAGDLERRACRLTPAFKAWWCRYIDQDRV